MHQRLAAHLGVIATDWDEFAKIIQKLDSAEFQPTANIPGNRFVILWLEEMPGVAVVRMVIQTKSGLRQRKNTLVNGFRGTSQSPVGLRDNAHLIDGFQRGCTYTCYARASRDADWLFRDVTRFYNQFNVNAQLWNERPPYRIG